VTSTNVEVSPILLAMSACDHQRIGRKMKNCVVLQQLHTSLLVSSNVSAADGRIKAAFGSWAS